jgi:hypothetical protein
MQKIYFIKDISKILDVSPQVARKYCRDGLLKSKFIGGKWLVIEENLEEFIKPIQTPLGSKVENNYHGDTYNGVIPASVSCTEK